MRKRTTHKLNRVIGALGIGLVAGGLLLGGQVGTTAAQAVNLPTWDDVQAAKGNEAAAAAKVTEIEGLIKESQKELERLRTESADANESWQTAETAAQQAAEKAATLETQAEESRAKADEAADQAAVIVAQMYRSGGVDRNMELFLQTEGDTADALLERLASMSKATERNTSISQDAEQAMNTASTLGKQAEAAQQERDRLSAEAAEKAKTAAQAADTKRIEIEAQEEQEKILETQLEALKDKTTDTVSGYQERLRVEEEQRRAAAAAEAERLRKEAEANANAGGGGGGGGGGWTPPPVTGGGGGGGAEGSWWRPTQGWVSTWYYQVPYHTGIDLATGCGVGIIAPQPGTVSFAGWKDGIGGNMVHLEHAGGFQTRYAHLSGFGPGLGTYVPQGGLVAYVGTTGMSTGCHLHYEVLINGSFVNPYPSYGVAY